MSKTNLSDAAFRGLTYKKEDGKWNFIAHETGLTKAEYFRAQFVSAAIIALAQSPLYRLNSGEYNDYQIQKMMMDVERIADAAMFQMNGNDDE